ncbi:uncharacterized protein LOC126549075 [Aphis gossypii]|nr:uncharacterized protein LOC126549075 [Aphis gossypii]
MDILNGRRIVDIGHIFNEIQNSGHSGGFGCSFLDMIFKREEKNGFFSFFYFHCKICGIEKKISSENPNNFECIPINKAVVNATLAIGIGYAQLFELAACIDIPSMSSNTYQSILSSVGNVVHASAWDEMKKAGDEEREIALKNDLRKDIENSPYHRFGQHDNCDRYFCSGSKSGEINLVGDVEKCGLMREVKNIILRLANNSSSLIQDVDNNACEQFNSLINKFIGGKRINFTQRNTYTTRIEAAIVSFNSKEYLRSIHKKMVFKSPGHIGKKYLNNLNRIRKNTIKRRCLFVNTAKKNKKKSSSAPDKDYGLAEPLIDTILPEELEIKKNCFLNKLKTVNLHQLNLDTRDQSENQKWFQERKKRLTASKFGDICKMRQNTSCKRQVHAIIYKPQIKTKELTHGIEMESYGRKKFEDVSRLSVETCGLIVDSEIPFLAASPDGMVGNDAILEIKCPYIAKDTNDVIEAVNNKLLQYYTLLHTNNGQQIVQLKRDHSYYYQVMGQLHITRRQLCYFVMYATKWIHIEKIIYDAEFWETKMVGKLTA